MPTTKGPLVPLALSLHVSTELLENIITSAFGSHGIAYWCADAEVTIEDTIRVTGTFRDVARNVAAGGTATFFENEDERNADKRKYTRHTMTRDKLLAGLGRWIIESPVGGNQQPDGSYDFEIDGPRADVIIQYALLNEQKYG